MTAMTAFEYTYATVPQTICADFAAMFLNKDGGGSDSYAVLVHDDSFPELRGLYYHNFYREFREILDRMEESDLDQRRALVER